MREENGCLASITTDHLGTPTEMYDEMGAPIWKARLDLFGICSIERGSRAQCPFRWPGQCEDEETGLYYNRFRYYDPSEGVYVSQDPIRLAGGLALYGYVADPLCEFDPFGENTWLGDLGEAYAAAMFERRGYTVLGSVQNSSGHGIDLVVRRGSDPLRLVEVKVNTAQLSAAQADGPHSFGVSRANRAVNAGPHWRQTSPSTRALAQRVLDEARVGTVGGFHFHVEIDFASGTIQGRVRKWCN